MSLKNLMSYLLMALFLTGSYQMAYAKIDVAGGLGHGGCAKMVKMAASHGHDHEADHSHGNTHSKHQQHDHEKECADGQCAHSYCVTSVFTAVITEFPSLDIPHSDGIILLYPQHALDNYPTSLYRPPRV